MTIDEKIGQLCFPTGWEMYDKVDDQSVKPSDIFIERTEKMPLGGFWATLRADPWTQKTLLTGLTPELAAKALDRKSTRLNSSHVRISYAVFCLKKKKKKTTP